MTILPVITYGDILIMVLLLFMGLFFWMTSGDMFFSLGRIIGMLQLILYGEIKQ